MELPNGTACIRFALCQFLQIACNEVEQVAGLPDHQHRNLKPVPGRPRDRRLRFRGDGMTTISLTPKSTAMITCYLDSQDYSTLTDTRTLTPERIEIREALRALAQEGKVQFVFSAAAVCEVLPISADVTRLAELKADLLGDLCGANALVSFDRLLRAEAVALSERRGPPNDMLDPNGNWFPDIPIKEECCTPWEEMRQRAEQDLDTMGLPRQQRRAAVRKLIKYGKPRGLFKSQIEKQNSATLANEFAKQYPMKPEHAEMMVRYGLGRATEKEFNDAVLGSLRDPRWMMRWFATNHALSIPLTDMVRKPGRDLGGLLRELVAIANRGAMILRTNGWDTDPTGRGGEISHRWMKMQGNQLVALMQRAVEANNLAYRATTPDDVDKYCPGVSTAVRSLYSSAWENVAGSRQEEPSDSQPVDALHALYAPYVRVFRADRFMAPHVQKQVSRFGTIVVPRLAQLVGTLESEIKRNSSASIQA